MEFETILKISILVLNLLSALFALWMTSNKMITEAIRTAFWILFAFNALAVMLNL